MFWSVILNETCRILGGYDVGFSAYSLLLFDWGFPEFSTWASVRSMRINAWWFSLSCCQKTWPLLVQGDRWDQAISLFWVHSFSSLRLKPRQLWGCCCCPSSGFECSALSILGLEERESHPAAFSPSSPYEHSKCSRTATLLWKETLLSWKWGQFSELFRFLKV